MQRVGVISDTHGLLRPHAVAALEGVELILHAGDVGKPEVLEQLERLAPVRAVRGNVDVGPWADQLPIQTEIRLEQAVVAVVHVRSRLNVDPVAAGYAAVLFGHSHKPLIETVDGVLYFNPGAAGPRRFRLPTTLGELLIDGPRVEARLVELL